MEDREMNSEPTVDVNNEVFMNMLASLDPSLWRIKKKLLETNVSGEILPSIIDAIAFVNDSTRYGTVEVMIENGTVTVTKSHSWRKLDIEIKD
jgi:hypothetical protein